MASRDGFASRSEHRDTQRAHRLLAPGGNVAVRLVNVSPAYRQRVRQARARADEEPHQRAERLGDVVARCKNSGHFGLGRENLFRGSLAQHDLGGPRRGRKHETLHRAPPPHSAQRRHMAIDTRGAQRLGVLAAAEATRQQRVAHRFDLEATKGLDARTAVLIRPGGQQVREL
jgi:hypothetical protein